jgi:hypothetical protein
MAHELEFIDVFRANDCRDFLFGGVDANQTLIFRNY